MKTLGKSAGARPVALRAATRAALLAGFVMMPNAAFAQRATENVVANADDAFGATVGSETTGIYSETDIRGFSPQVAGNARLDGVYFDLVGSLALRLVSGSTVRVGFAALDQPFPAPTGIVDYHLRGSGDRFIASGGLTMSNYNGDSQVIDVQTPVIREHLSLALGYGRGVSQYVDGASTEGTVVSIRPTFRTRGLEVSPFYNIYLRRDGWTRPIITTNGAFTPQIMRTGLYLGQSWARNEDENVAYGVTAHANLGEGFSLRGGFVHMSLDKTSNFVEVFAVADPNGLAHHVLVADPQLETYSDSWEMQLAWARRDGRWRHQALAGVRGRSRHTESGGSDVRNFGDVTFGELDPEPQPVFTFGPANEGQIEQTHFMLGYLGRLEGVGQLNLGIQTAEYEANFRKASGDATSSSANPWLYNASLAITLFRHLSAYVGFTSGLEDNGAAPETAANRNEQLPATETEQIDGGVRLRFGQNSLVASLFQISKPYFSFDAANRFTEVGDLSQRGFEISFSGAPTERLHVVAGAVLLDPVVSGDSVTNGFIGERPTGTPAAYFRFDAQYRTDIWGGLTPTLSIIHTGERAGSARMFHGEQLMLPAHTTLDIGARYAFRIAGTPMSIRATLANVFDDASWKVLASNTYQMDDRRRFSLSLIADF